MAKVKMVFCKVFKPLEIDANLSQELLGKKTDKLNIAIFKSILLGRIVIFLSVALIVTLSTQFYFFGLSKDQFQKQRIVLHSSCGEVIEVGANRQIPDSYALGVIDHMLQKMENWHYSTYKRNQEYVQQNFMTRELASYVAIQNEMSKRSRVIEQERMTSTFKFDHDKSKVADCGNLAKGSICIMAIGERVIYKQGNIIFSRRPVAYLMIANAFIPTIENPYAFRVRRFFVKDDKDSERKVNALYVNAIAGKELNNGKI